MAELHESSLAAEINTATHPGSSPSTPIMPSSARPTPLAFSVSDSVVHGNINVNKPLLSFSAGTKHGNEKGKGKKEKDRKKGKQKEQPPATDTISRLMGQLGSGRECEELIYQILSSMPRSNLSSLQRRIAPLLQFDVVGSLPNEVALQIFSHLPYQSLLTCALVSRRWCALANDQTLWKALCFAKGWEWREPMGLDPKSGSDADKSDIDRGDRTRGMGAGVRVDTDDDEGKGDSDEEDDDNGNADSDDEVGAAESPSFILNEMDSGFASMSTSTIHPLPASDSSVAATRGHNTPRRTTKHSAQSQNRHTVPAAPSFTKTSSLAMRPRLPNYKLLYQTHLRLHARYLTSSYRLSVLQTRGSVSMSSSTGTPTAPLSPTDSSDPLLPSLVSTSSPMSPQHILTGHTSTIYCVQLYTHPLSHRQVIFTGSRDQTVREWDPKTGNVVRVIAGVHVGSVLSLCVRDGWLVSGGSDKRVAVWELHHGEGDGKLYERGKEREEGGLRKILCDHTDSVLCVRFDEQRLVSCSKDRTIRVYSFPDLQPLHTLAGHRAAVNAVALSGKFLVSGSGDRSIRIWDVETGKLVQAFEDHHTRGIASIDFKLPYIVSGSSDKHLRLINMNTMQGWSTSPQYDSTLGLRSSDHVHPYAPAHNSLMHGLPHPTIIGPNNIHVPQPSLYMQTQMHMNVGYANHICHSCGSTSLQRVPTAYPYASSSPSSPSSSIFSPTSVKPRGQHSDLVRSVLLGPDFVVTGSYDLTVKIWDRATGALVTDLTGGHTGRIFCVAADRTKVVSCGEDQRICVWDFSHGIDTSFIHTSFW